MFAVSDRGVGCARVRVGRTRNVSYRFRISSWRALIGFLARGRVKGRRLGTRRSLARPPPNDLCTTSAPHKLGTTSVPSSVSSPSCCSDSPASNRLPNGAVYEPRSLTPPALSVLCRASSSVGACMLAIEPPAPAFLSARVRVHGVVGYLVLLLGDGEGRR